MKLSDVLLNLLLIVIGAIIVLSLTFNGRDVIIGGAMILTGILRFAGR